MKKILFFFCFLFSLTIYAQDTPIPFLKDGKWGYCNKEMKVVIPCIYDEAFPFFEDRALVQFFDSIAPNTKSFFINSKGEVVIKLNNSTPGCPASRFQNGLAIVENYNIPSWGETSNLCVINKFGEVIHKVENATMDPELSMIKTYSAAFNKDGIYTGQIYYEGKTQSVFIFNDKRKPIILDFPYITSFNAGHAFAKTQYIEGDTASQFALINNNGEIVIPAGKFNFSLDFNTNPTETELLFPFSDNGKCGYTDEKGQIKIEPKFEKAFYFSEGLALVARISGYDEHNLPLYQYGYIDTNGNLVIPFQFIQGFNFREGIAEVALKDSVLFIDTKGNRLFSFASSMTNDVVSVPGMYGAYNYDHGFINGFAALYINDMIGFIDRKGAFAIKPFYYGLFRIGPSMVVSPVENGIVRLSSSTVLGYQEYYVDINGKPYIEQAAHLLPARESAILIYSHADFKSKTDTLLPQYCPKVIKFTGKKGKIKGKKGEWIEINGWNKNGFVFSADFNINSIVSINPKGSELYETKTADKITKYIPAGTILFLAPKEHILNLGSDKMINVLLYNYSSENERGFETESLWIKANNVKLLKKQS